MPLVYYGIKSEKDDKGFLSTPIFLSHQGRVYNSSALVSLLSTVPLLYFA